MPSRRRSRSATRPRPRRSSTTDATPSYRGGPKRPWTFLTTPMSLLRQPCQIGAPGPSGSWPRTMADAGGHNDAKARDQDHTERHVPVPRTRLETPCPTCSRGASSAPLSLGRSPRARGVARHDVRDRPARLALAAGDERWLSPHWLRPSRSLTADTGRLGRDLHVCQPPLMRRYRVAISQPWAHTCLARGQRCGKWTRLPTLWLGNRVLRFSEFDDLGDPGAEDLGPAWAGAHGPSDAIGDPEQRLIDPPPVLEHETRLSLPVSVDRALVVDVLLPALDDKPGRSTDLDCRAATMQAMHRPRASNSVTPWRRRQITTNDSIGNSANVSSRVCLRESNSALKCTRLLLIPANSPTPARNADRS